jgi:hypothetical protein
VLLQNTSDQLSLVHQLANHPAVTPDLMHKVADLARMSSNRYTADTPVKGRGGRGGGMGLGGGGGFWELSHEDACNLTKERHG